MAEPPAHSDGVAVTVRYFAAARAAAGRDSETLTLPGGATVAGLVDLLAARQTGLATVLSRCSYLCDEVAVRDETMLLRTGNTIDVLPPFSGG